MLILDSSFLIRSTMDVMKALWYCQFLHRRLLISFILPSIFISPTVTITAGGSVGVGCMRRGMYRCTARLCYPPQATHLRVYLQEDIWKHRPIEPGRNNQVFPQGHWLINLQSLWDVCVSVCVCMCMCARGCVCMHCTCPVCTSVHHAFLCYLDVFPLCFFNSSVNRVCTFLCPLLVWVPSACSF